MIVIFQCYGGAHSSVIAAWLYVGKLSRSGAPLTEELLALPYYDRTDKREMGKPHYIGTDRFGNPVLALGSGKWGKEIREILSSLIALFPGTQCPVAVIDCLPCINTTTRVGGCFSRYLGIAAIGRPLVNRGIRCNYFRLLRLVESFEKSPGLYLLKP
jgi:hypothetical protein